MIVNRPIASIQFRDSTVWGLILIGIRGNILLGAEPFLPEESLYYPRKMNKHVALEETCI